MTREYTRRQFLGTGGIAAAGLGLGVAQSAAIASGAPAMTSPAKKVAKARASEKIVIGLIGCGGMGGVDLGNLMAKPEVEVAALCDVDRHHLNETTNKVTQKYGRAPRLVDDFRRMLEMKDVDGVIVATPDHWHALPAVMACQAGKDVYLEKPVAHNIVEGQTIVNAAKRYHRVIQVGTWQRSTQHFVDAIHYVRSGALGKISMCRAWTLGNAGCGHEKPTKPPENLNYDMWVGPAAWQEYQANRCHFNFRWYFNYASGLTGDWGVHMIDIILLGMSRSDHNLPMPRRVETVGGKIVCGATDDRTTPDTQISTFQFVDRDGHPDWILQWEIRVGAPGLDGGGVHGAEFIGQKGRLLVDRSGWTVWDADGKPLPKPSAPVTVNDHWQNWLDCIKQRQLPRSDIWSMNQTTTVCHLANLAYLASHSVRWDDARQMVTDSDARNLLPYQRPYRKPWALPRIGA